LSLEPATLEAVVRDLIRTLARHGIRRVFVFSAHGGNVATLRAMRPALAAACTPVAVDVFTDLDGLTAALHAASVAAGGSAAAAGHHAGEVETSIMLALAPARVRAAAMAAGLLADTPAPQALFYPDLRANAPDGVVGDPRGADAARGSRYLRTWVDVLLAAYRGEKNHHQTTGTQKP
jgi:creatinine amidohydrolase